LLAGSAVKRPRHPWNNPGNQYHRGVTCLGKNAGGPRRIPRALVFLWLLLCGGVGVLGQDWRGFHGLEKRGFEPQARAPIEWGPDRNVRWRAAIEGKGHSSPVLEGGRVYVTTAVERSWRRAWKTWFYRLSALAVCGVLFAGLLLVRDWPPPAAPAKLWRRRLRLFLILSLLLLAAGVVIVGPGALHYAHSIPRASKVTLLFAWLCLFLAPLPFGGRSSLWLGSGLASLAVSLLGFPLFAAADRLFPLFSGLNLVPKLLLLSITGLGLGQIGWWLWSRRACPPPDRRAGPAAPPAPGDLPAPAMNRGLLLLTLAALATSGGLLAALSWRLARFSAETAVWRPEAGWWTAILFALTLAVGLWLPARWTFPLSGVLRRSAGWIYAGGLLLLVAGFLLTHGGQDRQRQLERAIMCFDAETGRPLWTTRALATQGEPEAEVNTPATPTPVLLPDRICAYFGSAGMMAADRQGTLLWSNRQLPMRAMFGAAISPLPFGSVLLLLGDTLPGESADGTRAETPYLAAIDSASGRLLWRQARPPLTHVDPTYATPLLTRYAGQDRLLAQSREGITAFDPASGRELWNCRLPHGGAHLVAGLVADDRRVYVLTAAKIVALDWDRLEKGAEAVVWSHLSAGEKAATPVLADGLLFVVGETGQALCLDAATGALQWKTRLPGRFFASVIATAEAVYFTGESGVVHVVARSRELKPLAHNSLREKIYATPAPAADRLFLRTEKALYCLEAAPPP